MNDEACLFDVLELSDDALKKVLPKISSRALIRLLAAYPRTLRKPFMTLLAQSMSPGTMEFLEEEIGRSQQPSFRQIRNAQSELIQVIQKEDLFPKPSALGIAH